MSSIQETEITGGKDEGPNIGDKTDFEDHRAVKDEFLNRGYTQEDWSKVLEYYRDETFPSGNPKTRIDKIEARMYRIHPEKHLNEKFECDEVNKIYTIASNMEMNEKYNSVPFSYQPTLEVSDFEGLEALVLDHSFVYGIMNNSRQIKLESVDSFEKRIARRMESMFEDLGKVCKESNIEGVDISGLVDEEDLYNRLWESMKRKTSTVSWEKSLELMDNVVSWNSSGEADIELRHPNNFFEKAKRYCVTNGYNRYMEYELLDTLREVSSPLPIESYYEDFKDVFTKPEDASIIKSASNQHDKFALLTYDFDFSEDGELERLEREIDSEVIPMLPDCANFVLQCLVEQDKI